MDTSLFKVLMNELEKRQIALRELSTKIGECQPLLIKYCQRQSSQHSTYRQ